MDKQSQRVATLTAILSLLVGCAGSPLGTTVERALEPDPQLEEDPAFGRPAAPSEPETPEPPPDNSPVASSDGEGNNPGQASGAAQAVSDRPNPGDVDFIGPLQPTGSAASGGETDAPPASKNSSTELDLAGVPADLKPYIRGLQQLGTLQVVPPEGESAAPDAFTDAITRREYARWLFETNNALFVDQGGKRLREASTADAPAFQDVPSTDPDFEAIQGLAAAGIIPSTLAGNSTAVVFQPEAPLSRETLLLWKIPLDTRAALPQTTPEAVSATWGFQDTAAIEPLALRAIAADFQLGDFSNIRRAFGYTTLLRPDKPVTRAEAAAVLGRFGTQTDGRTVAEALALRQGAPEKSNRPPAATNGEVSE